MERGEELLPETNTDLEADYAFMRSLDRSKQQNV